ncbi:MAG: hypothetical protein BMS9Abin28_2212 [Anaerolineae bacterium]|nr:MAG: hypothetical protein BMS9Abin28_2212 [Anaerolineae bacterium]
MRRRSVLVAPVLTTLLTAVLYLAASNSTSGIGFPLDDAWIHQTYARNLGEMGDWAFIPGSASAGSTAPIWSVWIALGYFAQLNPLVWTHIAGLSMLALLAWLAARWYAVRFLERRHLAWLMAILIPLEWHLAWASLSGMETLALAAIALLCFYWLEGRRVGILEVGLVIGLGVWIRPDALTLIIAPIGYLAIRDREKRLQEWLRLGIGIAVPLIPYLAFQRWLSGELWPNTFFAKQAEYAALRELPVLVRLLAQAGIPGDWLGAPSLQTGGPLIGVLIALLPGVFISIRYYSRARQWERLIPLVWAGLFLAIYAIRLPVTYQHGRYAIPVIPVLLVLSFEGMLRWIRPRSQEVKARILSRAWVLVVAISSLTFWLVGAGAYGRDVAIIESEMVATARWIEDNTPSDAVVAAHDIGAIGYFAGRELIDMAGLVSPEVIPFIRDESALARHLDEEGADYLVTFPGWYPELTAGRSPLFVTGAPHSPAAGGENMAVYAWNR